MRRRQNDRGRLKNRRRLPFHAIFSDGLRYPIRPSENHREKIMRTTKPILLLPVALALLAACGQNAENSAPAAYAPAAAARNTAKPRPIRKRPSAPTAWYWRRKRKGGSSSWKPILRSKPKTRGRPWRRWKNSRCNTAVSSKKAAFPPRCPTNRLIRNRTDSCWLSAATGRRVI